MYTYVFCHRRSMSMMTCIDLCVWGGRGEGGKVV